MATVNDAINYARRQSSDNTGSRANAIIEESLNAALWMLAADLKSPFYLKTASLALNTPYSTGTVAITQGASTLTLTGGTWPSWAASGEVYLSGLWYTVASRDSDTVLTLDATWAEADLTAATYTLYQDTYPLATDLIRFGDVFYDRTVAWQLEPRSAEDIYRLKATVIQGTRTATYWAVKGDSLLLWPYPKEARAIHYLYYRTPATVDISTDGANTLDIESAHLFLLHRAIDYQLYLRRAFSGEGDPLDSYKLEMSRSVSSSKTAAQRAAVAGSKMSRRSRSPYIGADGA